MVEGIQAIIAYLQDDISKAEEELRAVASGEYDREEGDWELSDIFGPLVEDEDPDDNAAKHIIAEVNAKIVSDCRLLVDELSSGRYEKTLKYFQERLSSCLKSLDVDTETFIRDFGTQYFFDNFRVDPSRLANEFREKTCAEISKIKGFIEILSSQG